MSVTLKYANANIRENISVMSSYTRDFHLESGFRNFPITPSEVAA